MNNSAYARQAVICERCQALEAVYNCPICKPFSSFCSKCDTQVHSFPSKKDHSRQLFTYNSIPNKNITIIDDNNNQNDYTQHLKSTNFSNLNQNQLNFQSNNCTSCLNNSRICNNCNNNNINCLKSSFVSDRNINNNNLSYYQSESISVNNPKVYTREFVNELKTIFSKEKDELLFKINTLETNLSRLKVSFSEQLSKMQTINEDTKFKSSTSINIFKDQAEIELKTLKEEHKIEINGLSKQLNEYKDYCCELEERIKEGIKIQKDLKSKNKEKFSNLKEEIELKELNYKDIKNHYEKKIETILRSNENQINEINLKKEQDIMR